MTEQLLALYQINANGNLTIDPANTMNVVGNVSFIGDVLLNGIDANTHWAMIVLANQQATAAYVLANGAIQNILSGNTSNLVVTRTGSNVTIDTRTNGGGGGGSSANTVNVYANDSLVVANAYINFNNTTTTNVQASANGTYESNIAFAVNTSQVAINTAPVVNPFLAQYFGVT